MHIIVKGYINGRGGLGGIQAIRYMFFGSRQTRMLLKVV